MMSATAILVFALGAAAEVPHWVQQKPSSFKVPSIASMIKPMLSKHGQQSPNSRRLQAIMSAECKAACPGVEDMIKAMMPKGETRRLDAHEEEAMSAEQMKALCDHMDALKCVDETKACQDEDGSKDDEEGGMGAMECMCACPKIMSMMDDGPGSDEKNLEVMCGDMAGTVDCITSTSTCASMAEKMESKQEVGLACEWNKKCGEVAKNLQTCVGKDLEDTWQEKKCDNEITADCCAAGTKMIECMGADCQTISMAMTKMRADKGDEGAKKEVETMAKARTTCPDAGIPSADAVSATASKGEVSDSETADFAAPGQTVSMLAMAAAIAASLMA